MEISEGGVRGTLTLHGLQRRPKWVALRAIADPGRGPCLETHHAGGGERGLDPGPPHFPKFGTFGIKTAPLHQCAHWL